MTPPSSRDPEITFDGTLREIHERISAHEGCPEFEEIERASHILYAASLLKEEGRAVRARVVIAPPTAFNPTQGPPDGSHAIRFSTSHKLTPNEIKRLSPAASFFHSVVAIWPDGARDKGFRIWGVVNTGPRWMNLVAGGRKPAGDDLPHPIIHVRDPGWLLFYHGYQLLAEWRGTDFHGPRMDVFQSSLLNERFADLRRKMVEELSDDCLPCSLNLETYAKLSHLISLQFVKRVINLVRTSGHGGSMVCLPEGEEGEDAAARWIDCKYSAVPDDAGLRFRHILQSLIRRLGELCDQGCTLDDAWQVFRTSQDPELDELEEALFELARFFSDLMQVDGTLVVDQRLCVLGFGGEIRVDRTVLQVKHAQDLHGTVTNPWNVQSDGTRHRSVYRLCSVEPQVIGFVISQDSQVRMIANVDDSVVFWTHTVV
ncbi:MAG: putative sensor domain DACNV-containing protein [Verrucomicrobium sp.]